jgi:hypothetical protein
MARSSDKRPPIAVGHVRLNVNVGAAARWLETVGLRPIVTRNVVTMRRGRGASAARVKRRYARGPGMPAYAEQTLAIALLTSAPMFSICSPCLCPTDA